jgi:hypothetical protein
MEYAFYENKGKIELKFGKISWAATKEAHNVRINGNHPGKSGNV